VGKVEEPDWMKQDWMEKEQEQVYHNKGEQDQVDQMEQNQVEQDQVDWEQADQEQQLLLFHPEKCHVLTLGKFGNIKHAHPYSLDGRQLEHVFEEKDLGILIDSELTFEEHIAKQVKKGHAILGIIN